MYWLRRRIFKIAPWVAAVLVGGTALFTASHPAALHLLVTAALVIIGVPTIVFLFLQICFWVQAWLAHGSPFHEAQGRPYHLRHIDAPRIDYDREQRHAERTQLKYCPLCKRKSTCRVQRGRSGIIVHVVKG